MLSDCNCRDELIMKSVVPPTQAGLLVKFPSIKLSENCADDSKPVFTTSKKMMSSLFIIKYFALIKSFFV